MKSLLVSFTFIALIIGFFQTNIYACKITAPKSLIITHDIESYELNSAFKYKNCNNEQIKSFNILLTDYTGTLNQRTLNAELSNRRIKLSNSFNITSLDTALNDHILLPKKWKIIDPKLVGQSIRFLTLSTLEHLQIRCNNCTNTGTKNIKFDIINPTANTKSTYWITGNLAVEVTALVTKNNIPISNQALKRNNFELKKIYSPKPETFFTLKNKLPYYKANRPLHSGQIVHFNDISPINLITIGTPVQVKLHANGFKLQSIGIPTRSGHLGQIIQLKNPKTHKIIIGKITNFNEVEVKL